MGADDEGPDSLLQSGEGAEPHFSAYACPIPHLMSPPQCWWGGPLLAKHPCSACKLHIAEQLEMHAQTPTLFKNMTESIF